MKVLVTGATSGLGRNAVEFLCQKGISVRATGRNEAMGKLLENGRRMGELVSSQAVMSRALIRCGTAPAFFTRGDNIDLANAFRHSPDL